MAVKVMWVPASYGVEGQYWQGRFCSVKASFGRAAMASSVPALSGPV